MTAAELRLQEAQQILEALGMDAERSNERSALVFLALANVAPESSWEQATNSMVGTRVIMDFIRDIYGKEYAPNTRETIRRFTLHQFDSAHLVEMNADKPDRPINSPLWNYRLTEEALTLIRLYGTAQWDSALSSYLVALPGLKELYAANRELNAVPLQLPNGKSFKLTPGGQNLLIKDMVEEFCPRFTPGGQILYVGDAGNKWALCEKEALGKLNVSIDEHGKMPDLIVYMPDKEWLILLEAASSHGPWIPNDRLNSLLYFLLQQPVLCMYLASQIGRHLENMWTKLLGNLRCGVPTTQLT